SGVELRGGPCASTTVTAQDRERSARSSFRIRTLQAQMQAPSNNQRTASLSVSSRTVPSTGILGTPHRTADRVYRLKAGRERRLAHNCRSGHRGCELSSHKVY